MGKRKKTGAAGTIAYIKRHWQLYVFFLLPALFLTLLFKYVPMGGILIAFMDYNPIQGILGSEWVGLEHFQRFLSSPDFMRYLMNTLKLSVYGLLGIPSTNHSGISSEPDCQQAEKEKHSARTVSSEFYFGDRIVRYCEDFLIGNRTGQWAAWNKYQLYDNAFCVPDNLYCKWNLAGGRLGVYYVHSCVIKCKSGVKRGCGY